MVYVTAARGAETSPQSTAVPRAIDRHHFAFFRGYLLGLDLRVVTDRYLETGLDLRLAKSTLAWIRDELLMAARRQRRFAFARIIRLTPGTIPEQGPDIGLPTLEEFQRDRDPESFYSEGELIALYEGEFKGHISRRAQRNERLRKRQLEALKWLEALAATDPAADDPVDAWFDPVLSRRLKAAGSPTLRELIATINTHGFRWWARVDRLGEKAAARILKWLQMHRTELGIPLLPHVLAPRRSLDTAALQIRRQAETGIVPLEHFLLPETLDGSEGSNRAPADRNRLASRNDFEAIQAWLRTVAANPHTYRAYRREAERILLWSIVQKRKPVSSLGIEDCVEYRDFLADPQPARQWVGRRNIERWSPAWRPFEGPLAPRSRTTAVTILRALFEWLMRARYLDSNPWDAIPKRSAAASGSQAENRHPNEPRERSLSRRQWQYLLEDTRTLPQAESTQRLRFILDFAYATGLRLSELVAARAGHLAALSPSEQPENRWILNVLGKRGKWRRVPFPEPLMQALSNYLAARGLPDDPWRCPPDTPIIAKLATATRRTADPSALSPSALYKILKKYFAEAAEGLRRQNQPRDADHLCAATTHWLRHTCGSHAVDSGVPVHVVQKIFGHSSLATTTIYIAAEEEQAYREMERFVTNAGKPQTSV